MWGSASLRHDQNKQLPNLVNTHFEESGRWKVYEASAPKSVAFLFPPVFRIVSYT
jgi:hypothetical protein